MLTQTGRRETLKKISADSRITQNESYEFEDDKKRNLFFLCESLDN